MIDIHTHILPGIDDGPQTWEDTIGLVRQGYNDGIRGFVATSHILDNLDTTTESLFTDLFTQLKQRLSDENLPMSVWLGAELHCQADFGAASPLTSFSGAGVYSLVELPLGAIPAHTGDLLFSLSLQGITPIIAHPERNREIQLQPRRAWEFARRGILFQINGGSITGQFGRRTEKTARLMLDNDLVTFVASDCHHAVSRPMILSSAYRVVERRYGNERADRLFRTNPVKAVRGEKILQPDPGPYSQKSNLFSRLVRRSKRQAL